MEFYHPIRIFASEKASILGIAYIIMAVPSTESATPLVLAEYVLVFIKDVKTSQMRLSKCFYDCVSDGHTGYEVVALDLLDTAQMEANLMVAKQLGVEWHSLQSAGLPYSFRSSSFSEFEASLRGLDQKADFGRSLAQIHSIELKKILFDAFVRTGIMEPDTRSGLIELSGESG
jgi:hypothetical protein